jgi:hypothetical protein
LPCPSRPGLWAPSSASFGSKRLGFVPHTLKLKILYIIQKY